MNITLKTQEEIETFSERELTAEDFNRLKRSPRSKTLRRALGLTQEEFSARYSIPLGTLRDWEQMRSEPDAAAKAYLHVIATDPEFVAKALTFPRRDNSHAPIAI